MSSALRSADAVVSEVLELAGVRTFGLDALLHVSSIAWSTDVATACVECRTHPRLLFNPHFVAEHCTTPHRLAFVLLHELSHISMGHTGLYPRISPAQNIAFDAVINASILHGLRRRRIAPQSWSALPESLYRDGEQPEFILRPPPGWPDAPVWSASAACDPALRSIHQRLYSDGTLETLTYGEIVRAVSAQVLDPTDIAALEDRLLGAHGFSQTERRAVTGGRDAQVRDMLGPVLAALPIDEDQDYSRGGALESKSFTAESEARIVAELRALIQRALIAQRSSQRGMSGTAGISTVDPSRDRRAAVRRFAARALGAPQPLLFRTEAPRDTADRRYECSIYLDVSGSMGSWSARLLAALRPLRRQLSAELHAFSTVVESLSREDFLDGRIRSTGGTDIGIVLKHLTARSRRCKNRSALLLTDAQFATPSPAVLQAFKATGAALHVGVIGAGTERPELPWAASVTVLAAR